MINLVGPSRIIYIPEQNTEHKLIVIIILCRQLIGMVKGYR